MEDDKLVESWRAELADAKYDRVRAVNPCLIVPGGSNLYGTANADSDLDVRGVFVESFETLTGFLNIVDHERDVDVQLNSVIRTLRHVAVCNPTAIETVFCPEKYVILETDVGRLVREAAPQLISTDALFDAYGNYAANQTVRLRNALAHAKDAVGKAEAAKARMLIYLDKVRRSTPGLNESTFRVYVDGERALVDVNLVGYDFAEFRSLGASLHQIATATAKSKAGSVGQRDLRKQASHIVRLLRTGADVLRGNMAVDRRDSGDVQLLLDIRNGAVPLDDKFFEMIDGLKAELADARERSVWPVTVDEKPTLLKFAKMLVNAR